MRSHMPPNVWSVLRSTHLLRHAGCSESVQYELPALIVLGMLRHVPPLPAGDREFGIDAKNLLDCLFGAIRPLRMYQADDHDAERRHRTRILSDGLLGPCDRIGKLVVPHV